MQVVHYLDAKLLDAKLLELMVNQINRDETGSTGCIISEVSHGVVGCLLSKQLSLPCAAA